MAEILFFANEVGSNGDYQIAHTAGSGLGFYGLTYGASVPIGNQQSTTFVTNSNGTSTERLELNNTAKVSVGNTTTPGRVTINRSSEVALNNLPNNKCPLNVRFVHNESVRVQNCKLRIFDRNNINSHASGVTTYVYEARHPSPDQGVNNLAYRGRTANTWVEFDPTDGGSPVDMLFTDSPGMSGKNTSAQDTNISLGYTTTEGAAHSSLRHDWYLALSSEPQSIGSKTNYGLYFTVEYL